MNPIAVLLSIFGLAVGVLLVLLVWGMDEDDRGCLYGFVARSALIGFAGWTASTLIPTAWPGRWIAITLVAFVTPIGLLMILGSAMAAAVWQDHQASLAWESDRRQAQDGNVSACMSLADRLIRVEALTEHRPAKRPNAWRRWRRRREEARCRRRGARLWSEAEQAEYNHRISVSRRVEAYKWLTIALSQRGGAVDGADAKRASLERTMTPPEIADAEQQVRAWMAKRREPRTD